MKSALPAGALLALACIIGPTQAAEDSGLARMALCQDSWVDWSKTDRPRLDAFGKKFRANFTHKNNDAFAVPNAPTTVLGLHVAQVYPESVGMGVGFSILVDASYDKSRAVLEKALGKKLRDCEASDGMHTCGLTISEQRTVTLMSEDVSMKKQALIGCYYYYEK